MYQKKDIHQSVTTKINGESQLDMFRLRIVSQKELHDAIEKWLVILTEGQKNLLRRQNDKSNSFIR